MLSAKLLRRKPLRESNPGPNQWKPDKRCAPPTPIAPGTGSAQLCEASVPWPPEHSREREKNSTINLPVNAGRQLLRSEEAVRTLNNPRLLPRPSQDIPDMLLPNLRSTSRRGHHYAGCPGLVQGKRGPWLSQHGQPSSA